MAERCIDVPALDPRGCPFCAYLAGERDYAIVSQTSTVAVLVTQEVRGEPHLLVVPSRHCETILELTDSEAAELMVTTREAARAIDVAFRRPGIAVWQNNGRAADQAIAHVHIHIAGTLDEGGTQRGPVPEGLLAEAEGVADRLRPHLRSADTGPGRIQGPGDAGSSWFPPPARPSHREV
jgi:histidine triad (HIT) family protein